MYYTIYKITNNLNNKYYIGKHKTDDLDDGYMGSGKYIKRAIEKYGKENFTKEILFIFETEEEVNAKEKELVVVSEETYNLCPGGQGGFGYINKNSSELRPNNVKNLKDGMKGKKHKPETLKWFSVLNSGANNNWYGKGYIRCGANNHMYGKTHSTAARYKISENNKKEKNSQYGTCWITNGQENKKIKKEELDSWLEKGYRKGRIIHT